MDWSLAWLIPLLLLMLLAGGFLMSRMPGRSHSGPLPPLTAGEADLQRRLREHVRILAAEIGERNIWEPQALAAAAAYLEGQFVSAGYAVRSQNYTVAGKEARNLGVEIPGGDLAGEIVLVGAHYDSIIGSPGANDNASGVAALLELARLLRDSRPTRTLRLVAFVNEEPPFFQTAQMGSLVYARRSRERGERIVAMLSLETLGYYTQAEGSQAFPLPLLRLFYPSHGNFLAFVGDLGSRRLLQKALVSFRRHAAFPSQGLCAPAKVTGVDWSDQWSFRQQGYPAIMVTDTALFRYPHYHAPEDTPQHLDYAGLARVTTGLAAVVSELAEGAPTDGH